MRTIIDLGKIRFQFRGEYLNTTQYEYNDVVRFGGDVFVYINVTATVGTIPTTTSHWSRMVSGLKAEGEWSSTTAYATNDVVVHGGSVYRAITSTTNNVPPNATYWEVLVQGLNHRGSWGATTAYERDDSVVHLGQTYRALTNHTSGSSFLADLSASNWELYASGTTNRGAYAVSTDYFKGDLVTVGTAPNLDFYISTTNHVSDGTADPATAPENSNWTRLIAGTYTTSSLTKQYAFFLGVSSN